MSILSYWDADIEKIDWEKNKPSVIRRIFERGNEEEINEIVRFYGKKDVAAILGQVKDLFWMLYSTQENKSETFFYI